MFNKKLQIKEAQERQVYTMSRALANAITMSAEYSGRRVKFTDFRK